MSVEDLERLALNEERIRESQDINRISDLPAFPFSSLDEVRAAKASGAITFGAPYQPRLVEAWGTLGEVFVHYFWLTWPPLIIIAFIVGGFISGRYVLLCGVLTTMIGWPTSSPAFKRLASPLVGLGWMVCVFFAFTNPVWAWIVGGFYGGYIFASTARLHLTMVLEERALASEVLFCYFYRNYILVVRDNRQSRFL
jgi:hypothetical protein